MSGGATDGVIKVKANGNYIQYVNPIGRRENISIINNIATIPVPEIPVFIELQENQEIEIIPMDWGPNIALTQGVTVQYYNCSPFNSVDLVHNNFFENW